MFLKDLANEDVWTNRKYQKDSFLRMQKHEVQGVFDPTKLKNASVEKLLELQTGFASRERLLKELNDWDTPNHLNQSRQHVKLFKDRPYELIILRQGILRCLLNAPNYQLPKKGDDETHDLFDCVTHWEEDIKANADNIELCQINERVKTIATEAARYGKVISSSELNLIKTFIDLLNEENQCKSHNFTWIDFFHIMASQNRFPRSQKSQIHGEEPITGALHILQEQAIVYEVRIDGEDVVGIPEDYDETIREWLELELTVPEYEELMRTLNDYFGGSSFLIKIQDEILGERKKHAIKDKQKNIIAEGVQPSDALKLLEKEQLKNIVLNLGIGDQVHKNSPDQMVHGIVNEFHQSGTMNTNGEDHERWLIEDYLAISKVDINNLPPRIKNDLSSEKSPESQVYLYFETATAKIFRDLLNHDQVDTTGQKKGRSADGKVVFDDKILLWDNKATKEEYGSHPDHELRFEKYIENEGCSYLLIIAPKFSNGVKERIQYMNDRHPDVYITYITAEQFLDLARWWHGIIKEKNMVGKTMNLHPIFSSGAEFNSERAKKSLKREIG